MHFILFLLLIITYYITGGDTSMQSMRVRRTQVIWMGFIIFLFAALRAYTVGTDIWGYFEDYQRDAAYISFADLIEDRTGRDPFFHCVLRVLSMISSNPQLMLVFVGGLVAFAFSYLTYYQKGNVLLFFVLFICFRMYAFTLSGLRQACAMSVVYIAYTLLRKHKYYIFVILALLASLFHQSALVSLLMLPLSIVKNDRIVMISAFLVILGNLVTGGALAGLLARTMFEDRFYGYIERSQGYSQWGLTFIVYVLSYLVVLINYKAMGRTRDNVNFHEDFRLFTMAIMFAFIGQTTDSVFRINYYFIFIVIPLIAQVIKYVAGSDIDSRKQITWLVLLIMITQYLILGASGIDEYEFFWEVPYKGVSAIIILI